MSTKEKKLPRGKAFGKGFHPDRFRQIPRHSFTAPEATTIGQRGPDGKTFLAYNGRYSVYAATAEWGTPGAWYVDPTTGQPAPFTTDDVPEAPTLLEMEQEQPAPRPQAPKQRPANGDDPLSGLLGYLESRLKGQVDPEQVRSIAADVVTEALKKVDVGTRSVTITTSQLPPVTIEGITHSSFEPILARMNITDEAGTPRFRNLQLYGPAGTGKTTLGAHLNQAVGGTPENYCFISCNPGMSDVVFSGRAIPRLSDGEVREIMSKFADSYDKPGVTLIDETDNADPQILNSINAATENGHYITVTGRRIERHPRRYIIAAMNTDGRGGSREYERNKLDSAFLDRFVGGRFYLDYCPQIERAVCPEQHIRTAVIELRKKVQANATQTRTCIVSTRMLTAVRALVLGGKMAVKDAIADCTADWPETARRAVGLAA